MGFAGLLIQSHELILFLCVFLSCSYHFLFLLQAFVHLMKGKCPQTILTDLELGLKDAVRSELPSTRHAISIWNIQPKISSWFFLSLGARYPEFKSMFDDLYQAENADDFEHRWSQMVSMFGFGSDKHIALLYSLRASWASSYMRGYFLARMATSAYLKSVESFLKAICCAQTCLRSFFEQVYQRHIFLKLLNGKVFVEIFVLLIFLLLLVLL